MRAGRTKQRRDEGGADGVQRADIVDAELGALPHRAPHHAERGAHERARDGQALLLRQLHHQVAQARKGAVRHLRMRLLPA